jgi:Siphovirus Gp157
MSKSPAKPAPTNAKTSTPPSPYAVQASVAMWERLHAALRKDDPDFHDDETEIEQRILDAGLRSPYEMLSYFIDTSIALDQKSEHAETLRKRYAERRDRYKQRAENTRRTVEALMEVLGTGAHEADLGTASFVKPRKSVVVTDIKKLAEKFIKRADPEPKKAEIATALRAGETVEGAEFSGDNEPPVLRVTAY